jgi:hypothetical protein
MVRDSYIELGLMVKSGIQGVSNSEVDADLEQIVLQNNEPSGLTVNA